MTKEANIISLKDAELTALKRGDAVTIRTDDSIYFIVADADIGALANDIEADDEADLEVNREIVESREVV